MKQKLTWDFLQKTIQRLEEFKPIKGGRYEIRGGERVTNKRVFKRLKKMGVEYEEK